MEFPLCILFPCTLDLNKTALPVIREPRWKSTLRQSGIEVGMVAIPALSVAMAMIPRKRPTR